MPLVLPPLLLLVLLLPVSDCWLLPLVLPVLLVLLALTLTAPMGGEAVVTTKRTTILHRVCVCVWG